MQIAIEIDEEEYRAISINKGVPYHLSHSIGNAILNGTPLPEHHGDLKDVSKLDVLSWQGKSGEFTEGVAWAMEQLDNLPTAIPATEEGDGK